MDVLVVNVGSSSVKLQVVDGGGARTFSTEVATPVEPDELERILSDVGPIDAVGHRIVHGGPDHVDPELVTDAVLAELDDVARLAPLHDPPAIEVVRTVRRLHPELPVVACFDTAFHATLPLAARTYAVPAEWEQRFGLRRFGFHGLNHRYVAHRAADLLGRRVADLKLVTCHLGAGASLAAVDGGRSVDTTMGFTPLAGLVMATRSGDVDPGALLWLLRHTDLDATEVEDQLWHRSGLAGSRAGRATCARCWPAWSSEIRDVAWPSTCTSTGCAPASRRWWRPSAGSTPWCSPAAWGSARRSCGPRRWPASRSWACRSILPPTPRSRCPTTPPTPTSPARVPPR
jgi:acetate kinase